MAVQFIHEVLETYPLRVICELWPHAVQRGRHIRRLLRGHANLQKTGRLRQQFWDRAWSSSTAPS